MFVCVCCLKLACFPSESLPADEKNLAYVAVTRAKRRLIMSPNLLTVLQKAKVSQHLRMDHLVTYRGTGFNCDNLIVANAASSC